MITLPEFIYYTFSVPEKAQFQFYRYAGQFGLVNLIIPVSTDPFPIAGHTPVNVIQFNWPVSASSRPNSFYGIIKYEQGGQPNSTECTSQYAFSVGESRTLGIF